MFRLIAFLAGAVIVSGCATDPNEIQAAYISDHQYRDYDCNQLAAETARVQRGVDALRASLKKTADDDSAQMAVGLILFWPALLFLEGGDGPQAQEYAQLRGQAEAIERVSIKRACGEVSNQGVANTKRASQTNGAAEVTFWQSISKSEDPDDFIAYLETYPNGTFVALARNKLKRLGIVQIESD